MTRGDPRGYLYSAAIPCFHWVWFSTNPLGGDPRISRARLTEPFRKMRSSGSSRMGR